MTSAGAIIIIELKADQIMKSDLFQGLRRVLEIRIIFQQHLLKNIKTGLAILLL
jgi:hypothetical protein